MSDLTGELIDGRYQLIRQLATGGMASIYEALDTRLDRKVAVKIMHSHLAQDEQFVERFIREAKAAAALTHPNIVAVQDQGWNQNGTPAIFIVMELIQGHTLREYLNEQTKLPITDGIKFLIYDSEGTTLVGSTKFYSFQNSSANPSAEYSIKYNGYKCAQYN